MGEIGSMEKVAIFLKLLQFFMRGIFQRYQLRILPVLISREEFSEALKNFPFS